ncbi:MGMT family protein [Candidatus Gracilibacteria bacterium]|nr:MGMT family protein [Candidatus Gracilibacteria bacterium]MCF7856423.1 MGMT family protein [Candidatus Gracilibacteria bacterium]MCF7896296.1 MGMT family protein [Candidatus Gracilibacteria bacterium]
MPKTFAEKVHAVVTQIPRGEVRTYSEVAKLAGNEKAARAVGNILNKNRNPKVPCHRVIRSDGQIGGFAFGGEQKIEKLRGEGVVIKKDMIQI